MTAELLELERHVVLRAQSGEEGLTLLETAPTLPDIILSDSMLPGITGAEFVARLRANPRWTQLPCIMVSGDTLERDTLLENGADEFVAKPFRHSELLDIIARFVAA